MNCRQARGFLMDDLNVGLAPGDRDALADHLSGCEACRSDAEALGETWRALGSLEVASPPSEVKAKLLQAIRAERAREKTILPALRRFLPVSLGAGFVSLGFGLLYSYQEFASLCMSWLGRALAVSDWPMEPFFFLTGLIYSSLPLGLAFGLLLGKVNPSPSRSAALAGSFFFVLVIPYVLWVCMTLSLGSAVSLVAGFVAGTLASASVRVWTWKTRLREVLA